jgi:hypothetical protein
MRVGVVMEAFADWPLADALDWLTANAPEVTDLEIIGPRIGHAHAKDVTFDAARLALNGLLDRRWPAPPEEMPWNFSAVGNGHPAAWWQDFMARIAANATRRRSRSSTRTRSSPRRRAFPLPGGSREWRRRCRYGPHTAPPGGS